MNCSFKNLFFIIFCLSSFVSHTHTGTHEIKAVFWSDPDIFDRDRWAILKNFGFFSSLFNAGRTSEIEDTFLGTLIEKFGAQTQIYKANDPKTNKPLPNIMREWLTGQKTSDAVRKAALETFKKDSFIQKIVKMLFTPAEFLHVTYLIDDAFKLIKKMKPGVMQVLASNYDPGSYHELKKSAVGTKVLPYFKGHVYVSGMLLSKFPEGIILQDPAFFNYVINQLNLKPEECLVINSDPAVIHAAKSLGMKTLAHNHGDHSTIKKQLKELNLLVK